MPIAVSNCRRVERGVSIAAGSLAQNGKDASNELSPDGRNSCDACLLLGFCPRPIVHYQKASAGSPIFAANCCAQMHKTCSSDDGCSALAVNIRQRTNLFT
jgi:hypothetical protein